MLESVVAVLREACREVVVVGQPRQLELEATFMADGFPRLGPLAGLVTGLEAICQPWALAVACDMPLLRSTALRRLLDAREDGFDAVVPVVGGCAQPLHALYRREAARSLAQVFHDGKRSPTAALTKLRVCWIPEEDFRHDDPSLSSFASIDTREEWEALTPMPCMRPS